MARAIPYGVGIVNLWLGDGALAKELWQQIKAKNNCIHGWSIHTFERS
jgi:hypothetical protein